MLKVIRCFKVICELILFAGLMPAFGEAKAADALSGATIMATVEAQEYSIIARNYVYLPGTIVVEKNRRVRLYLTSIDRAHDIKIEKMNLRAKVNKGEVTVLDFTPAEDGTYEFVCDIYCGPGHRGMKGKLVVVNGNESGKE
ncbi:cupredoxin domain-containing protein [Candidatus Saganbacteria bacterium]|nr:cupredoxin domain-containing protein [Candidatus Saganbacteria bacterium]